MDINKRCKDCKIKKKCLKWSSGSIKWQNDHNCYFYEPKFYVAVENWIRGLFG